MTELELLDDRSQGTASVTPRAAPASAPSLPALTPRERDVLALVAAGHTLEQVGRRLGMARNTAHTHLKHVYRKLGISTRSQAVVAAIRLGLLKV
jgi:DNA-binding CsgD family transcriptional regulator